VQRKRQIELPDVLRKIIGKIKALRGVVRKQSGTTLDRATGHVHAKVFRISGQLQLRAIPATEVDDRPNGFCANKFVQDLGFELRQATVGAGSRGAILAVHALPERCGSRKAQTTYTSKDGELREFARSRPKNGDALYKTLQTGTLAGFTVHHEFARGRSCTLHIRLFD